MIILTNSKEAAALAEPGHSVGINKMGGANAAQERRPMDA